MASYFTQCKQEINAAILNEGIAVHEGPFLLY